MLPFTITCAVLSGEFEVSHRSILGEDVEQVTDGEDVEEGTDDGEENHAGDV